MAFNPFDVFRRNQKILFACLTVFIMFTFVLSFGQGDFFSQVPRWLASGRSRGGTVLAEVDGSKVYSGDLEQARGERVLANQYMFVAARRGADSLLKYVQESQSRVSAEARPAVEAAAGARNGILNLPGLLGSNDPQSQQIASFFLQQADRAMGGVTAVMAAPNAKPADQEVAAAAKSMLELTLRTAFARSAHYFDNQPNASNRDVMDFLLWKKKADQLGIRLNDAAVVRLANDEFFGKLSNDDWKTAEDALRGKQGFNADALRRALGDEFRVRAAQLAVLGGQSQRAGTPATDSPYDFYKFFRDQTNAARYALVTVPADNYLDKVTGTPTEAELLSLFQKARSVEPNPGNPSVGIKEPRRVKLGYVEITGDEPFYKAKAAATVKAAEESLQPATPPGQAAAALAGPAVLAGAEGPVGRQYAQYKTGHNQQVLRNWGSPVPFGGARPLDSHVLEPLNVVALAAAFAAGGPLTAPTVFVADGFASDRIAKLESVLPMLTVPVGPGTGSLAGVLGAAGGLGAFTSPLPKAAVAGLLAGRARDEVARTAAGEDMITLGTELSKPGVKPEDAQKQVEAFAKERSLAAGGSTDLRDVFMLVSDPGLKKLTERFEAEATQGRPGLFVDPAAFGFRFLFEMDPTNAGRQRVSTGLYKPQTFPESAQFGPTAGQPAFLVWRTEDKPAESPRTLDDPAKNLYGQTARDKTIAAWKRLKARELARKAADELAKLAPGFGQSSVEIEMKLRDEVAKLAGQFTDPGAKSRVQYHEIDRVAPLVSNFSFMPGQGGVSPFTVGRSSYMPFPGQDLQSALMDNRAKPLGTAAVAADVPGDRVYVAVLLYKEDKSADVFGLTVYGPTAAQMQGNELASAVRSRHQEEVRRENRDRAVSLLKAEFRYDKESDELNKKADLSGD